MLVLLFAAALCTSEPAYVLADVRLFDGRGGAIAPAHIVIRGALIEKILAAADKLPEGVEVRREFAGMTVIPGLIDAHVHHFSDEFDALFLASGVTTVRDLGGDEASILERRRTSFLANDRPRVYVCGPIFDGSPPVWPFSVTPSTPEEARSEVERLVKAGVDEIKVYTKLEEKIWRAIIEAAHDAGKKAIGHVPLLLTARDAVLAGQDEIEHFEGVADACIAEDRRPKGLQEYMRRGSDNWVAASPECLKQLAAQMAEAGTVNCPTLVVLERYSRAGLDELAEDPRVKQMSVTLRSWWDGQFAAFKAPWGSEFRKTAQAALAKRLEFVKMLHDAGAPLILGSDTPNPYVVPGDSVHEELALLVRAGLSPKDALLAAGAQAAEAIGAEAEIGTLQAGKIADLVVLERDPLADIANTRTIAAVIHRGVLRTKAQLVPQGQMAEQR